MALRETPRTGKLYETLGAICAPHGFCAGRSQTTKYFRPDTVLLSRVTEENRGGGGGFA